MIYGMACYGMNMVWYGMIWYDMVLIIDYHSLSSSISFIIHHFFSFIIFYIYIYIYIYLCLKIISIYVYISISFIIIASHRCSTGPRIYDAQVCVCGPLCVATPPVQHNTPRVYAAIAGSPRAIATTHPHPEVTSGY